MLGATGIGGYVVQQHSVDVDRDEAKVVQGHGAAFGSGRTGRAARWEKVNPDAPQQ